MRILASLLLVLICSSQGSAKRGNGVRGTPRSPGLEDAEKNYETAKQLYYEALQLVEEAEKAGEEEVEAEEEEVEAEEEEIEEEVAADEDETEEEMEELEVEEEIEELEDEEDEEEFVLMKKIDAITTEPQAADRKRPGGTPPKSGSAKTDYNGTKFSPSVCGKDRAHVHEQCIEKRPICKYKKISDANDERGFRLLPDLEPGQHACLRRCDTRFGLGREFCLDDEDCVTGIPSCTECDILTDDAKCHPFKND